MKIELAKQAGHPVPQFVVHAESELESMLLEAFVAYGRQKDVKFHLHGMTSTNGRPTSFNFGYVWAILDPVAPMAFDEDKADPLRAKLP